MMQLMNQWPVTIYTLENPPVNFIVHESFINNVMRTLSSLSFRGNVYRIDIGHPSPSKESMNDVTKTGTLMPNK